MLIGPKEPFFWNVFKKSSECRDNKENPLDRSSKKTVDEIAIKSNSRSFFPFEAPFQPFIDWAKKCSTMGSSPVRLWYIQRRAYLFLFEGHSV